MITSAAAITNLPALRNGFILNTGDNRVKKSQLNAQLILSTFLQPLQVSGLSRPIIRRYNRTYIRIGTYNKYRRYTTIGTYNKYRTYTTIGTYNKYRTYTTIGTYN
jgi:hypothetical protein